MLTITRTLMGTPAAVLLDEPSEGLAPKIVGQMAEAIRSLKRKGPAVRLARRRPRDDRREGTHPLHGTMEDQSRDREIQKEHLSA
jgi:branched-chain amino acid transport system ATP-binding protein